MGSSGFRKVLDKKIKMSTARQSRRSFRDGC